MTFMIDLRDIWNAMRGATEVALQHHQILLLPRKMTLIIYNALSNKGYPPTSPNTAPATKNDSHDWSSAHMKHHLQCTEQPRLPSNITKYCACHEKWLSWLILVTYETSFTMRWVAEVTLQHHRILRLPRKVSLMIDPRHIWNVIYNARSNKGYPPTSPNTAPATKNDSQEWSSSSSHMKRHLQCAEQQRLPSNITKYCACHEKWLSKISIKFLENSWSVIYNAGPIRDPRMIREWNHQSATRLATEVFRAHHEHFLIKNTTFRTPAIRGYFSRSPRAFSIEKYNMSRSSYHSKISPNAAPATKSDTWTSPNTAPATKSDTLLFSTLLYSTLRYSTLLHTLLYSSLLYSTLLYSTLLYPSLLHSTPLYSTLLYYSLLFATLLYSTQLFSTIRYSTRLFYHLWLYYSLTLLFLTLRSRSYIGSFSSKLPLIIYFISFFHQPPLSWWINMEHIGRRWSEQPWVTISVKT